LSEVIAAAFFAAGLGSELAGEQHDALQRVLSQD
jgi:hypothetical protein